jgi:FAD/FMN-containing dehydrogenase
VAAEALNRKAADAVARAAGVRLPRRPWVLLAGFEEMAEAVAWQIRQLEQELVRTPAADLHVFRDGADADLWQALADLRLCDAAVTAKLNARPSAAAVLALAADAQPGALVQAHAVSGVVYAHLPGDGLTADGVSSILKGWEPALKDADGNWTLERCPPAWKASLPVWGVPRGDWPLMRAVKRQLDPRDLFNPGRLAAVKPE